MKSAIRAVTALIFTASLVFPSHSDVIFAAPLPLTGSFARVGQAQQFAMELAQQEINAHPSSAGTLKIVFADDGGNPEKARNEVQRLLGINKVRFLIGAPTASTAAAVDKLTQERGVLFVSTGNKFSSTNPPLRFHIGNDLGQINAALNHTKTNSNLRPTQNLCSVDSEAHFQPEDDFAICGAAFIDRKQWSGFQKKIDSLSNIKPSKDGSYANLAAATAYVATKLLYEAISKTKGTSDASTAAVAETMRATKFNNLFGEQSFSQNQQITTIPMLVFNPVSKSKMDFTLFSSKSGAAKCDSCKHNGECPQGAAPPFVLKDDCCKKSDECPQGLIMLDRN